jgi:hypothetical protein
MTPSFRQIQTTAVSATMKCQLLLKFPEGPLSPITSSQVIPNVFIWYFPFENFWPAITSACVTSYIPQDGLLGPPAGAERTVDDEATIDTTLVEQPGRTISPMTHDNVAT